MVHCFFIDDSVNGKNKIDIKGREFYDGRIKLKLKIKDRCK